jgi:hypothetical protein
MLFIGLKIRKITMKFDFIVHILQDTFYYYKYWDYILKIINK